MKRVVEELGSIETVVASLYEANTNATSGFRTTASSDSSRKTYFSNFASTSKPQYRSNWSNYTPSQLESSYVSNIHRLFSERVEIFTSVEFTKASINENYNKFISATDTIRRMKDDFKQMETDVNLLMTKMQSITTFSEQITGTLQGTRSQLCRLSEKHSLLKRLQFLSTLPAKLKSLIEEQNYAQAVQDYLHAQKVFAQYGRQPSFDGIQRDCDAIMADLKEQLRSDFQRAGNTAQSLTEIGELLLQLDEKTSDLASEMLTCAGKRLHEQIVMLQDQTERDMLEFVDMGIDGFLNDLALVVTSYFDMFVAKHYEHER